ncbi:amidohydrolase family protein [Marivibrio halodurans]|uniref:Amidohydrolase family protein n=1 Tax=Marivibrio halodurans TaxID=2039722 RepID=A0A8J7V572_9PROT|nr:amidohydrolase family protein [Marivibrio halodurans]MBP5858544.1 amidohydrolase family protein [Marivibrio halodurans]
MTTEFGAIDYWCNMFTPEGLKRLYLDPPEFSWPAQNWAIRDRLNGRSVDEFIAMMAETGFGRVGIPAGKVYNWRERHLVWNLGVEDIAPIVDRHPEHFFGLYGINPFLRMDGVRELESAVLDHNVIGAVMHPHGFGLPPYSSEWFPYFAKCVELDIPVFSLVGHAAEEMPSEPGRPLHLEQVALYFPELRIVGVSGWPWVDEMISMAWKFPNVFYGTSQYAPRHWAGELKSFVRRRGVGKVLFGTGFPVLDHADALVQIDELGLSDEARRALLSETAKTVFGSRLR